MKSLFLGLLFLWISAVQIGVARIALQRELTKSEIIVETLDDQKIICDKKILQEQLDDEEDDSLQIGNFNTFFSKNTLVVPINSTDFKDLYKLMEIDSMYSSSESEDEQIRKLFDQFLGNFTTKRLIELIIAADKLHNDMDITDVLKDKLVLKLFAFKQNYVSYHNFMQISLLLRKLPVLVQKTIFLNGAENFKLFLLNAKGISGNPEFPDSINKYSFEQKILYALLFFNAQENKKYVFGSDIRLDKEITLLKLSDEYFYQFVTVPNKQVKGFSRKVTRFQKPSYFLNHQKLSPAVKPQSFAGSSKNTRQEKTSLNSAKSLNDLD